MTLPVSSHGLTPEGIATTRAMLKAGVELAGVNAMTMDFGPGEGAEKEMLATIERALEATQLQVQSLWRAAGLASSAGAAWGHVGVTPMLGVNDVTDQRFTTKDARGLAKFIDQHGHPARLGLVAEPRLSSAAAPSPRSANSPTPAAASSRNRSNSPTIFSGLRGTKTAHNEAAEASSAAPTHPSTVTDDPATSPYPIWRPASAYAAGYKVVWQGQIYQAGWWNQGTAPGTAAADSPSGPWQPIGPVPAGSTAPQLVKIDTGEPPEVVADHRLPRRRRGQLQRPALPGPLVHAGRTAAGRTARQPERPLGTALQVPRRAQLRRRNQMSLRPQEDRRAAPPVGGRHEQGPDAAGAADRRRLDDGRRPRRGRLHRRRLDRAHGLRDQRPGDRRRRRPRQPDRDGRLPHRGQPARRLGDRLPLRPARLLLPDQRRPPHAAGDARRVLRRAPARRSPR